MFAVRERRVGTFGDGRHRRLRGARVARMIAGGFVHSGHVDRLPDSAQRMSSSSTSKTSVAFGGIDGGLPAAP